MAIDKSKEQLLDMMVFVIAFRAYIDHLRAVGADLAKDDLLGDAAKTAQRYIPELQDLIEEHLKPLIEGQNLSFLEYGLRRAERGSGVKGLATVVADFFDEILTWLKNHKQHIPNLFPGKTQQATQLCNAVILDNPESILNACASIPPCSRLQLYKWIDLASDEVGIYYLNKLTFTPVTEAPKEVSTDTSKTLAKDLVIVQETAQQLASVSTLMDKLDPTDPNIGVLAEQKADLQEALTNAISTSENPQIAQTVAAIETLNNRKFASKIGEKLGMTPEQEVALISRGLAIIAAGAGSGKTRVLAGKVVYHIEELGVKPEQILATSFTKKSAGELKDRIEKYGKQVNPDFSLSGSRVGTTHSIALKLCSENLSTLKAVGGPNAVNVRQEYEEIGLIKVAMAQVTMLPERETAPPPIPKGLFDGLFDIASPKNAPSTGVPTVTHPKDNDFNTLRNLAEGYLNWAAGQGFGWSYKPLKVVKSLAGRSVASMTPLEISEFNAILSQTGMQKQISKKEPALTRFKLASEDAPKKKAWSQYDKIPANQFFNVGIDKSQLKFSAGDHARMIDTLRADMITSSQAYDSREQLGLSEEQACVYCAYDWLKKNDPVYKDSLSFDDMLELSVAVLIANPQVRNKMQSQLKVLLIDEAQDQSGVQHLLFGLLAGYLDASTLKPREDGKMTADTYAYIGDDKQAIYSFRGARPQEFIDKSDTKGGNFTTYMLDTNFRSAPEIVQAANSLIAHNEKQIPMACKHDPNKESGVIKAVEVGGGFEAIPGQVADFLSEMTQGDEPLHGFNDYGVALRTNAEVLNYGLALLEKGIPFRSKLNFFKDSTVKAMVHWLKFAAAGDNVEKINEAVLKCFEVPKFNLNDEFVNRIQYLGRGQNYLEVLNRDWNKIYYGDQSWRNRQCVQPYVEALNQIRTLRGEDPGDILRAIFTLKGGLQKNKDTGGYDQTTVTEALMEKVKGNSEMMNLLREESINGNVTEAQIKEQAFSTLKPLMGLLTRYQDIGPAVGYISQLQGANEKLARADSEEEQRHKENNPAVTLDTVHGWKGLEVKHLITSFTKDKFPHARAMSQGADPNALEEERRLAYVAITRGQESVRVFYPQSIIRKMGEKELVLPGASQFIEEACLPVRSMFGFDRDDSQEDEDEVGYVPDKVASMEYSYEEGDWIDIPEEYESELDYNKLNQD